MRSERYRASLRSWLWVIATCSSLLTGCATGDGQPGIQITPLDDKIRVTLGGELFSEYLYGHHPKPIVYPVIGPHGVSMTRHFPMKPGVRGEADDHEHHRSLWFAHGDVNGIDFWTEGPGKGTIVHDALLAARVQNGRAVINTTNQWHGPDGTVICTDSRQIVFHAEGDDRIIDYRVTLHASHGELTLGDTKEGTMAIRTHPLLRLRPDADRGVTNVAGHARNSEGQRDVALWGKRARWVDYWAPIGEHTVGIAIFDHPANPRHPTWWHARDYGLITANPFGIHDFENKPRGTGTMHIDAGGSVTFRYRFIFHEGDASTADIDKRYQQWSDEPL